MVTTRHVLQRANDLLAGDTNGRFEVPVRDLNLDPTTATFSVSVTFPAQYRDGRHGGLLATPSMHRSAMTDAMLRSMVLQTTWSPMIRWTGGHFVKHRDRRDHAGQAELSRYAVQSKWSPNPVHQRRWTFVAGRSDAFVAGTTTTSSRIFVQRHAFRPALEGHSGVGGERVRWLGGRFHSVRSAATSSFELRQQCWLRPISTSRSMCSLADLGLAAIGHPTSALVSRKKFRWRNQTEQLRPAVTGTSGRRSRRRQTWSTASLESVAIVGNDNGIGNPALLAMMTLGTNPVVSNTSTTGKIHWSFDSTPQGFKITWLPVSR